MAKEIREKKRALRKEQHRALSVAFCWAARAGDTAMVEKLLEAGAGTIDSYNALLHAAEKGHVKTIAFLLNNNDNLWQAKQAFAKAAEYERLEACSTILEWIKKKKSSAPVPPATNPPAPPSA